MHACVRKHVGEQTAGDESKKWRGNRQSLVGALREQHGGRGSMVACCGVTGCGAELGCAAVL